MAVNYVERIDDRVRVRTVLISVSDKSGLDELVKGLIGVDPNVQILSTGGTHARIAEILGDNAIKNLRSVSDYTGQPEMQGGLVKTLDFKIYLGLLSETYNESHSADLSRAGAAAIDMVVANLYPFRETVAKEGATPEHARANIDIGGPCMVRAAAKNYIRVASVTDPGDYSRMIHELKSNDGCLTLRTRFELARKAFKHTAEYDSAISVYLDQTKFEAVLDCYRERN